MTNKLNVRLAGRAISSGLVIGRAYVYHEEMERLARTYEIEKNKVEEELLRIERAIESVRKDLQISARRIEADANSKLAAIFEAHDAILQDPVLRKEIRALVEQELINASQALARVFRRWEREFRAMTEQVQQQHADDIADLGRRLLREIAGLKTTFLEKMPPGRVLVARRLLPSDTVVLPRRAVAGIVVDFGGRESHTALLAEALGIPTVAQIPDVRRLALASACSDARPIRLCSPGASLVTLTFFGMKQGYLWTCNKPGGDVFYRWETSRAADCLQNLLGRDFKGTLQCDGYSAYRAFADRTNGIELSGCWAHVRRKFHDALEQTPGRAGWVMRQIQHLYRIESVLRETKAGPGLRQGIRSHQSRPILERVHKALLLFKSGRLHLPQSLLGQAVDYALLQWTTLDVYLRDGRIEIDNNLVENAIRPTAVGKKNWLFVGEAGAGQRGAIIYTIIESCRRRNIDPYTYLRDVLTRLPLLTNRQIPEVTPAAWAKNRRAACPQPS